MTIKRTSVWVAGTLAIGGFGYSNSRNTTANSDTYDDNSNTHTGFVGPRGSDGRTGPTGERGRTGAQGNRGYAVARPRGAAGPAGERGAKGLTGARGVDGQVAVGPAGDRGDAGRAGDPGVTGETGVHRGSGEGYTGERGVEGPVGERGDTGETGATGGHGATGVVYGWTTYREFWFDSGRQTVHSADEAKVTEIARYMKENPSLIIGIDGTMPRNSNKATTELSNNRVKSIRDGLIAAGVPSSRIKTGIFGDSKLRPDNRVEVLIKAGF